MTLENSAEKIFFEFEIFIDILLFCDDIDIWSRSRHL